MFDFEDFVKFIKRNDMAGITNPVSDLDKMSIQDLRILFKEYQRLKVYK